MREGCWVPSPTFPLQCGLQPAGRRGENRKELPSHKVAENALTLHSLGALRPLPFLGSKPRAASGRLTHETWEAQGLGPQYFPASAKTL